MISVALDIPLVLCLLIGGIMFWSHRSWKHDIITKRVNTLVQSLAAIAAAIVLYVADGSLIGIFIGLVAVATLVRMLFEPA